ncbi:MAG: transposase [Nitrososphaerota archaeon]|jgi:transposase|nr:transposase [Nitrososphaerota archaeon]
MAQYFALPNRAAQGYMRLFREKLHLKTEFSYKTIERAYNNPVVREILSEVFELTQLPLREIEHEFGPDATGLATSCKQNYETDRQKNQTYKGYAKVLVMVGLKYKLFSAFRFASSCVDNESPYFGSLLDQTAKRYVRVSLVAGDGAYLSRHNCNLVAALGGVPRFYPKKGTPLRQKGSAAWRKMLEELTTDPQKWLEAYHKRSNVEGSFSILKRDNPTALRKKLDARREQEAFGRACNQNLKRLCYLNYTENINPKENWPK